MEYKLIIEPAIEVEDRYKVIDLLQKLGYEVYASGQFTDCSKCDISFEKEDKK